jgi:hypothetical protein
MQAIPSGDELNIGNDNGVELDRLYDKFGAVFGYDNAATVSYVLRTDYTPAGTALASGSLSYVAATNGRYRGIIPYSTSLADGTEYIQEITAILSNGRRGFWQTRRMARRRVA